MAATERISMTMRELDRFKIIQDVTASSSRGVQPNGTSRQIRRRVGRLRDHGPPRHCQAIERMKPAASTQ